MSHPSSFTFASTSTSPPTTATVTPNAASTKALSPSAVATTVTSPTPTTTTSTSTAALATSELLYKPRQDQDSLGTPSSARAHRESKSESETGSEEEETDPLCVISEARRLAYRRKVTYIVTHPDHDLSIEERLQQAQLHYILQGEYGMLSDAGNAAVHEAVMSHAHQYRLEDVDDILQEVLLAVITAGGGYTPSPTPSPSDDDHEIDRTTFREVMDRPVMKNIQIALRHLARPASPPRPRSSPHTRSQGYPQPITQSAGIQAQVHIDSRYIQIDEPPDSSINVDKGCHCLI